MPGKPTNVAAERRESALRVAFPHCIPTKMAFIIAAFGLTSYMRDALDARAHMHGQPEYDRAYMYLQLTFSGSTRASPNTI